MKEFARSRKAKAGTPCSADSVYANAGQVDYFQKKPAAGKSRPAGAGPAALLEARGSPTERDKPGTGALGAS